MFLLLKGKKREYAGYQLSLLAQLSQLETTMDLYFFQSFSRQQKGNRIKRSLKGLQLD